MASEGGQSAETPWWGRSPGDPRGCGLLETPRRCHTPDPGEDGGSFPRNRGPGSPLQGLGQPPGAMSLDRERPMYPGYPPNPPVRPAAEGIWPTPANRVVNRDYGRAGWEPAAAAAPADYMWSLPAAAAAPDGSRWHTAATANNGPAYWNPQWSGDVPRWAPPPPEYQMIFPGRS